jgi:aerotaxis receptor
MPKVAFENLWETINDSKTWNGIVKNRTKNGDFYWVNATVFSSKNVDGSLRYISVRVKPTKREIDEALVLYKKMIQGE